MPVTVRPAQHGAKKWVSSDLPALSAADLLRGSCEAEAQKCDWIIQSSFDTIANGPHVYSSSNGFVLGAVKAYSQHHHLIIRPEDVWFSILAQLNIYVGAHAEELRGVFVAHDGQKELEIKAGGNIYNCDFGALAEHMTRLISENIVDPKLRDWIMPSFTTTTDTDRVVASVIMMGTLQHYFTYKFSLLCGLPSVTLLGVKKDWEDVYSRLDTIPMFGHEPTQWYHLLKPVIARFVKSFDCPETPETTSFWQTIAHYSGGGSGPTYLSGWITAFCFWDKSGKSLYDRDGVKGLLFGARGKRNSPRLCLDGSLYHRIDSQDVPPGYVSVPVIVDDDGVKHDTIMLAGSVGLRLTNSKPISELESSQFSDYDDNAGNLNTTNTIQAESGWWMFETRKDATSQKVERHRQRAHTSMNYSQDDPELYSAASYKHESLVRDLLQQGADVNATTRFHDTALHAAASRGHEGIVAMLLNYGADVECTTEYYGPALHAATARGHQSIVMLLLRHGANINSEDGRQGTALRLAALCGREDMVMMLLEQGANVNAFTWNIGTALQAAACSGHEKIVKILLEHGADIDAEGGQYGNALQVASFEGWESIVKLLLLKGANAAASGGEYGTALQMACLKGHSSISKMLLQHGASYSARDGRYGTALWIASYEGHESIVEILLQQGATACGEGGWYDNALQAATLGGHQDIINLLVGTLGKC